MDTIEMTVVETHDELILAAAKALHYASDDERDALRAQYIELLRARTDVLKSEHDYNSPDREKKERWSEFWKHIGGACISSLTYVGVSLLAANLEKNGCLTPEIIRDAIRKIK